MLFVEGDAKGFGNALDGRVTAHTVGVICQTEDVALVFGNIEFVFDFADDLFQHVFDGDESGHAAEFVDGDRKVIAVAAKLAQQIVQAFALGHEGGGSQQGANIEPRRALQLEQVFREEYPDDVFFFALVHRKTRVRGVDDDVQQRVVRRVDVDEVHARCCDHYVASRHVGHAKDALEHDARLCAYNIVVFGICERFDQLVT